MPAYPQGTVEDYNRAYSLREKYNPKHVLYSNVVPHWVKGSDVCWYIRNTTRGKEYVKIDARQAKRSALFNQEKLAALLSERTGKQAEAYNLPLNQCRLNPKADTLRFESAGRYWAYAIKKNTLVTEGEVQPRGPQPHWMEVDDEKGRGPVTSPDGKYTAFIKNDNIYVRDVASGKEKQLSIDGRRPWLPAASVPPRNAMSITWSRRPPTSSNPNSTSRSMPSRVTNCASKCLASSRWKADAG